MRVLLTTAPGYGHFMPLVPVGRALAAAGHTVGVATAESIRTLVERENFEFVEVPTPPRPAAHSGTSPSSQRGLTEGFLALFVHGWATAFLNSAETVVGWRPDVFVREEGEFGAPVLAAELGLPCVDVGWGPARPPELVDLVGEAMRPLWQRRGREPDRLNGTYRWLYVDPCPPSLQAAHASEIRTRHLIRPVVSAAASVELPDWLGRLSRPAVYITLGTVPAFAADVPFFRAAIAALSDEGVDVIVTLGPQGDPAALGEQPSHVHVERFIPQAAVFPRCVAAITNGGSGSTMGALAHGVPVLAVSDPRSPSQVRNGEAIAACGAGRSLGRAAATPERLREEIRVLFSNASHREHAARVASEIAGMPSPGEVVAAVERVVTTRTPWVGA